MSNALLPIQSVEDFCITFDKAKRQIVESLNVIASARSSVFRIIERFEIVPHQLRDHDFDDPEQIIKDAEREMLKSAWAEIIKRSGVRDVMVERRQNELNELLRSGELPPLNAESIRSFIDGLRGDLDRIVSEAIEEASRVLRPHDFAYKTNDDGWELGEKAIIEYGVISEWDWRINHHRRPNITAIDNAFHLLDGKGVAKHPHTLVCAIESAMQAGIQTCETPYFRVKWFKNGNIHWEFLRMDLVAALNARTGNRALRDAERHGKYNPKAKHRQRRRKDHSDLNYFVTPEPLAKHLVDLADLGSLGHRCRILEPSAGEGAIVKAIRSRLYGAKITAVELDYARAGTLRQVFGGDVSVVKADFLDFKPNSPYPRIIANPPFSDGRDAEHILHMLKLLAPGGVLVSVAGAGVMFRTDRVYVELRGAVAALGGTISPLPEDSFKESGTSVSSCVILVKK